jgi:chromosome segregation ATPase
MGALRRTLEGIQEKSTIVPEELRVAQEEVRRCKEARESAEEVLKKLRAQEEAAEEREKTQVERMKARREECRINGKRVLEEMASAEVRIDSSKKRLAKLVGTIQRAVNLTDASKTMKRTHSSTPETSKRVRVN